MTKGRVALPGAVVAERGGREQIKGEYFLPCTKDRVPHPPRSLRRAGCHGSSPRGPSPQILLIPTLRRKREGWATRSLCRARNTRRRARQSAAQSRDLQFLPQVLTQPLHFALRENASQRIVPSCILTCSPRQRGETRRRPFRYGPPSDCFENAKFHGADGQPRCSPKARGPFHSHPWL